MYVAMGLGAAVAVVEEELLGKVRLVLPIGPKGPLHLVEAEDG